MLIPSAPRGRLRRGLVLLCAAAALAVTPARADDLQDASRLLKAGQPQQALERVNRVLAANPRDPQARFLKGLILTEQGKQQDAIEVFTRLTQDFPNLPEPYNNLAVIYAGQGQYEKARAALEQSIRTHPSYATAYENLGDVYAKLASQAYGKALQLDAGNTGAQNKLSLVRELVREPAQKTAQPAVEPAKPPVVADAPTVTQALPKPPAAADAREEILKTVNGWAEAWSKKDVDAYLGYYAKDFKTPAGEGRTAWEKTRRERIQAPRSIHVGIDSPRVTMPSAQEASVTFRQTYRSDSRSIQSRKALGLTRVDGRWLIKEEKTGAR
jgi:tetratricopeptide (TPR) repeat protein